MPFDLKEGAGLITGIAGLAASAVSAIRYFTKKEQLAGELKRSEEHYAESKSQYTEVVEVIGKIKLSGPAALLLKSEVDTQVGLATKALQATASSIPLPVPGKNPTKRRGHLGALKHSQQRVHLVPLSSVC